MLSDYPDYSRSFDNCAVFLPSITPSFAEFADHGSFKRPLPFSAQELNFLNPASDLFYYPWALYSAGQAAASDTQAAKRNNMVSQRKRARTTLICDSGGYQIASHPDLKWEGEKTVRRSLEWMEAHGDYSMIMDFPAWAISEGYFEKHKERLLAEQKSDQAKKELFDGLIENRLGLDFNTCLYQTLLNNQIFAQYHKPGKTRFINVMQGRNWNECEAWYEPIKHYQFSGWAFPNLLARDFSLTLRLLVRMRDDGLLNKTEWIHFLGVGVPGLSCLYTVIKQTLFETTGCDIGVSFDASSPFSNMEFGTIYTGYIFDQSGWVFTDAKPRSEQYFEGIETLDDYCAASHKNKADKKRAKLTSRSADRLKSCPASSAVGRMLAYSAPENSFLVNNDFDMDSYPIAITHNVQVMVEGFKRANQIFFGTAGAEPRVDRVVPALQDMADLSGATTTDRTRPTGADRRAMPERDYDRIPMTLLAAEAAIRQILRSETPFDDIGRSEVILRSEL